VSPARDGKKEREGNGSKDETGFARLLVSRHLHVHLPGVAVALTLLMNIRSGIFWLQTSPLRRCVPSGSRVLGNDSPMLRLGDSTLSDSLGAFLSEVPSTSHTR
jgi:hypothetical protein